MKSDNAIITVSRSVNPANMCFIGGVAVLIHMRIKFPVVPDCGRWTLNNEKVDNMTELSRSKLIVLSLGRTIPKTCSVAEIAV
jgi:hypothetical protein